MPGRSAIFSVRRCPASPVCAAIASSRVSWAAATAGLRLAHAVVGGEGGEPAPFAAVASLVAEFLEQGPEPFVAGADHAAIAAGDMLGVLEREAREVTTVPIGRPRDFAPQAWAQSSIRISLWRSARAIRASRSQGLTVRWTAMIALVFG
jgi:hypothetical protein